jgi:hypothetical protein
MRPTLFQRKGMLWIIRPVRYSLIRMTGVATTE